MPSCVINCCKNNSCFENKSSGMTFHRFPADITRKENWIKAVRDNRNDVEWLPSKFSVICSLHFEEIDLYNTKCGYRRLKKNATPKKIHLVNSEWCQEIEASGSIHPEFSTLRPNKEHCNTEGEVGAAGIICDTSDKLAEDNISKPQDHISNYQPAIRDSDQESLFDTPNEYKLRQQARKYKLRYKVHVRQIKTLKQKVFRLKKKNASLKTVLKDIKDKKNIDTNVFSMLGENTVVAEICNIIKKKKLGKKKIKYSSEMKKFCLTLNFCSPQAYEYVRQTFRKCLPHSKTLSKWNAKIKE